MPPQKGRVTHHQDQLINPVNFKTTNETPKRPIILMPPPELELFAISFSFYISANIRIKYVSCT